MSPTQAELRPAGDPLPGRACGRVLPRYGPERGPGAGQARGLADWLSLTGDDLRAHEPHSGAQAFSTNLPRASWDRMATSCSRAADTSCPSGRWPDVGGLATAQPVWCGGVCPSRPPVYLRRTLLSATDEQRERARTAGGSCCQRWCSRADATFGVSWSRSLGRSSPRNLGH